MNELMATALKYAERGWPVFPLHGIVRGRCTCGQPNCSSPGKHPLVRRGVKEATTDARVIKEWWRRWGRANIGLATGSASGLVVIDIDLPPALDVLEVVIHKLPKTLTALTGGGGIHLLLGTVEDRTIHNHTSRVPGIDRALPGIDVRGDGGYIVAPPSTHMSGHCYGWLDPDVPIAPAPDWLREPTRRPIAIKPPRFRNGDGTPYGLAVLRNQLEILSRAQVGERNHTLNRCAFIVGMFIRAGHLDENRARAALHATGLQIGLHRREISATLGSALQTSS